MLYCLSGCTDERWQENGGSAENVGGLPIEFIMDLAPVTPSSRTDVANVDIGEKTEFAPGDIIQIVANFYKKSETGQNQLELMTDKSVCCFLTYQKGENDLMGTWVNTSGASLYWPWESEEASFAAFYYPGFDGLLDVDKTTLPVLLDSLDVTTDPLMANEVTKIPYGNAVYLTFKHQCTRLVLTDLEAVTGGASYTRLWMENKKEEEVSSQQNAFQLSLNKSTETTDTNEPGKLSLKFEFTQETDGSSVLIGGRSTPIINSTDNSENAIVFFLPPGDYSNVALTRRFGRPLLSWEGVTKLSKLEAGKSYTVSLTDLLGNITIDDDDDWWKDDETYIPELDDKDFSLSEFLRCIEEGQPYSYVHEDKTIDVMEKTADNYLVLKYNIDFKAQDDTQVTVKSGITFDGNGHFFKNVNKRPVFETVQGHVQNLGITESIQNNVSLTTDPNNPRNSEFGILARESQGMVDGIRLDNITIQVTNMGGKGPFMIGALVGNNNTQPITNIEVNDIQISSEANANDTKEGTVVMLGGIIGQNGENASLENVSMSGDGEITVTNNTPITVGSVYTGGLVGLSASHIKNCKVRADVSAYYATGTWVYTGGLAGSMRNQKTDTTKDHILVDSSQNEGTVRGGECLSDNSATGDAARGHSATGGLVGYSLRADIRHCTVSGTVETHTGTHNDGIEYYTLGGIAGAVRAVDSEDTNDYPQVFDNDVYAIVNTTNWDDTYCFAGWLAGVAPANVEATQPQPNTCYIETSLNKVGIEDNSSAAGQTPSE